MTSPGELYACLYAREFPAQSALRLRPELQNTPIVIIEGDPPLQSVCSYNAKARKLGIAHGMTRVDLDIFSSLNVLPRSRAEESSTRSIMLECAGAFSPRLEDRSDGSSFLCVIDIVGTERLLGSPPILARELRRRVQVLGIRASVAISSNFHAAIAYARGSTSSIGIIRHGEEASALKPLPLSVLDLSSGQAETFALWGIRTLGTLAALPETELIARMGQSGKRLLLLARGQYPHHFVPLEEDFRLEERLELDTPIENLEALLFYIGTMLGHLISRTTNHALALASVTITLTLGKSAVHTRTVRPALPTNDRQLWIKLVHLDLEAHPPSAAILAVTLAAVPGSTSKVQLGLFSPQLPEPMRLDVTLAHLRALVGDDCVGRPVLQDTHQPDSFRMEPFTVPTGHAPTAAPPQAIAAMRQLRPPERACITLRDRRPASFLFRNCKYEVEHAYGPWLAEGDWWNRQTWALEQWDLVARSTDGAMLCCCLVRDMKEQSWQVVTLYD